MITNRTLIQTATHSGVTSPAFIAAQPQVNEIVHDIVHGLGGSLSAEHGIGP